MRIRLLILAMVLTSSGCSSLLNTPGVLTVQVLPENEPFLYIRSYDHEKPYHKRDMVPQGNNRFTTQFPDDCLATVDIMASHQQLVTRSVKVAQGTHQYLEINLGRRDPDVEFIRMKANRELRFKPIDKTSGKKSIYVSYIDYIGQNLFLRRKLEEYLASMGYKMVSTVSNTTELIITINLVDFMSEEMREGFNQYTVNQYRFKINVEQRIGGQTALEENHIVRRNERDHIDYGFYSYPMDDSAKVTATAHPLPPATPLTVTEPSSPGLLVMMGLVEAEEDDEEAEKPSEEADKSDPSADDPEKTDGAAEGTGAEEKTADVAGTDQTGTVEMNDRTAISKASLGYHAFQEEALVEASVRIVNYAPKDDRATEKIIDLLAIRLAHIFNI
jgi:hypothetical protein